MRILFTEKKMLRWYVNSVYTECSSNKYSRTTLQKQNFQDKEKRKRINLNGDKYNIFHLIYFGFKLKNIVCWCEWVCVCVEEI